MVKHDFNRKSAAARRSINVNPGLRPLNKTNFSTISGALDTLNQTNSKLYRKPPISG
jgi:hypothetical protein